MTTTKPNTLDTLLQVLASDPDALRSLGPILHRGMCDDKVLRAAPLIGLCGPKGCGKSTVSKALARLLLGLQPHELLHPSQSVRRLRFAGPVKAMLRALGLTEAQVDGDQKETPCALLGGRTPREAMQTLGTEWGRSMVSSELWCNATMQIVDDNPNYTAVIDDVRFDNEAAAIRARGGYVIEIYRVVTTRIPEDGGGKPKRPSCIACEVSRQRSLYVLLDAAKDEPSADIVDGASTQLDLL